MLPVVGTNPQGVVRGASGGEKQHQQFVEKVAATGCRTDGVAIDRDEALLAGLEQPFLGGLEGQAGALGKQPPSCLSNS